MFDPLGIRRAPEGFDLHASRKEKRDEMEETAMLGQSLQNFTDFKRKPLRMVRSLKQAHQRYASRRPGIRAAHCDSGRRAAAPYLAAVCEARTLSSASPSRSPLTGDC